MLTAAEILDSVKAVLEERERNYDHPLPNFNRIAYYWDGYIRDRQKLCEQQGVTFHITAKDIALLMILMKVAREQFQSKEDNWLDMIGYAMCGLRIAASPDEHSLPVHREW
jgi:hypothetical protein